MNCVSIESESRVRKVSERADRGSGGAHRGGYEVRTSGLAPRRSERQRHSNRAAMFTAIPEYISDVSLTSEHPTMTCPAFTNTSVAMPTTS